MAAGFVYLLTNEYMPDVYKIGCTERAPHARAAELSASTGVPAPFKVFCYIEVTDCHAVERQMHEWLKHCRISPNREFFHENIRYAVSLMWWLRSRLAFVEPLLPGEYGMFIAHDAFADISSYPQLTDPWAPKITEIVEDPSPGVDKDFDAFMGRTVARIEGENL